MSLSLIVAHSRNRIIGKDNQLLWKIRDDLLWFKKHTLAKNILMGRRTWQSLPKTLSGRTSLIVSSSAIKLANTVQVEPSCHFFTSLNEAIHWHTQNNSQHEELMVCGGAHVYQQLLPYCSKLYITTVHCEIDGDVSFPSIDYQYYQQMYTYDYPMSDTNQFPITTTIWQKNDL